jgi:DNA-binding XRE family transcriptional regulator
MTKSSASDNRIAEVRKARKLTQQQLADLVGVHWITISKIERGVMQLTLDWAEKLSAALNADVGDLFVRNATREIRVMGIVKSSAGVAITEEASLTVHVNRTPFLDTLGFWLRLADKSLEPYFCEGDLLKLGEMTKPNSDGGYVEYYGDRRIALIIADDDTKYFGTFSTKHDDGSVDFRLLNGRLIEKQRHAKFLVVTEYVPEWAFSDIAT